MAARLAGAGSGKVYALGQNHDINITPFVDVMLVLLIVFMVAAPLATNTLKLDLPRADHGRTPPANLVVISIDGGGRIFITTPTRIDAPIDLGQLSAALASAGRSPRISVQADQRVKYGRFVEVLNRLQDDGFYNVNLIVTPRA